MCMYSYSVSFVVRLSVPIIFRGNVLYTGCFEK